MPESLTKSMETVTISAPGKALIAGGYVVLERPNIGLTIASTSRFYATVCVLDILRDTNALSLIIESPQFHSCFCYTYQGSTLTCTAGSGNEFIEKCLSIVLSFIKEILGTEKFEKILKSRIGGDRSLGIKLRADNDFYSQISELQRLGKPLLSASLREIVRFNNCPKDESGNSIVAKTGMGSSAALTTALTAALLHFFGVVSLSEGDIRVEGSERHIAGSSFATAPVVQEVNSLGERQMPLSLIKSLEVIHNLAQLVHAMAQGKIGSGFDVSAAVYGTQSYCRFSAENFEDCMETDAPASVILAAVMDDTEAAAAGGKRRRWDQIVERLFLPPHVDIVMGDVCGGSSSTSMSREVLRWRSSQPDEADRVWKSLAQVNRSIFESLVKLCSMSKDRCEEYNELICRAVNFISSEWVEKLPQSEVLRELLHLKSLFKNARDLLRYMGESAGVGIEPPQQQALVDATEEVPGVLCAGVPGAGGVDAVFAITLSDDVRTRVEEMWAARGGAGGAATLVCPLLLRSSVGVGVRVETDITWDAI